MNRSRFVGLARLGILFGVVTLLLMLAAPASAGERERGRRGGGSNGVEREDAGQRERGRRGGPSDGVESDEEGAGGGARDSVFVKVREFIGVERINARSEPDGSHPRGVFIGFLQGKSVVPLLRRIGPVTCLRVEGNRASIVALIPNPILYVVEDNGDTGDRYFRDIGGHVPRQCPSPAAFTLILDADEVRIQDAP